MLPKNCKVVTDERHQEDFKIEITKEDKSSVVVEFIMPEDYPESLPNVRVASLFEHERVGKDGSVDV